jgi:hypothetical protein
VRKEREADDQVTRNKSSAKAVKPLGQAQWRENKIQPIPPRGGGSTAFALLALLAI